MSEAWDWYLRQKENAKARYEKDIRTVNRMKSTPQHILHIKLCSDQLSEKDNGKHIFSEPHVNQLMMLAYEVGVKNAKSADASCRSSIISELREEIINMFDEVVSDEN